MPKVTEVRPSPIAGAWYQSNPDILARLMDGYMDAAILPELPGQPVAVVAPHAGHIYSGPVAGYAFAAVRKLTPDVIAVVSPMHHAYPYQLITTAHGAYGTPLGAIRVNRELVHDLDKKLVHRLGIGLTPVANDPEHSLEIELPFLQRAIKSTFTLLPVMVRTQNREACRALGEALAETLTEKNALLVASTDLSHFHNAETATRLDRAMLEQVEAFSPEGLFEVEQQGRGEACGLGALAAVLWAAKALGGQTVKVLHHATSGDVTGDMKSVVGYGAAVVLK
jgi:hypothetical protein